MSTARIRNLALALGAALLIALGVAVWAVSQSRGGRTEEVTLHARDMAFFLPGSSERNPTLQVPAGATLRLTVVNDEPGMQHDLAVDELGLEIGPLGTAVGSRQTATVELPAQPGRYPYVCKLHAQMMRGTLEVTRE